MKVRTKRRRSMAKYRRRNPEMSPTRTALVTGGLVTLIGGYFVMRKYYLTEDCPLIDFSGHEKTQKEIDACEKERKGTTAGGIIMAAGAGLMAIGIFGPYFIKK